MLKKCASHVVTFKLLILIQVTRKKKENPFLLLWHVTFEMVTAKFNKIKAYAKKKKKKKKKNLPDSKLASWQGNLHTNPYDGCIFLYKICSKDIAYFMTLKWPSLPIYLSQGQVLVDPSF